MKRSPEVRWHLQCEASVALQRISEATAREGLPFLSPTRPRDRSFLSRIMGSAFRILKWPSGSRRGGRLVPILHGEVRNADGGSLLSSCFRLHPFSRIFPWFMATVMLGMAATIWLHDSSVLGRLFAAFALLMSAGALLFAFQDRRPQRQEVEEILQFLRSLFQDVLTRDMPL